MSSDPEWKYVNVRRLFIFLEHSIDKSTQWAVFEPNNERLWANIRQTIEDFLLDQWQDGRADGLQAGGGVLRPLRPNDDDPERPRQRPAHLPDRGRADEPAEFVIFRIGQWTADAKLSSEERIDGDTTRQRPVTRPGYGSRLRGSRGSSQRTTRAPATATRTACPQSLRVGLSVI